MQETSPPIARRAADIAPVAALFADPTPRPDRHDPRRRPGAARLGVIAHESGVSASTASAHLSRLVAGGALAVEPLGGGIVTTAWPARRWPQRSRRGPSSLRNHR